MENFVLFCVGVFILSVAFFLFVIGLDMLQLEYVVRDWVLGK